MSETRKTGKMVVIGDGACGKTCLLEVFKSDRFPEEYVPTVVDNFSKTVKLDDEQVVDMALWDTAGQEDYDSIRPLSLQNTDLLAICFDCSNKKNIGNIPQKWMVEANNYCPNSIIFLIGLKKDLRDDADNDDDNFVATEDGEKLANEIGAAAYIECSAKTRENVDKVFKDAAKNIFNAKETPLEDVGCCGGKFFCC